MEKDFEQYLAKLRARAESEEVSKVMRPERWLRPQ